ncbi:hypothetical protein MKW98_028621 [Papaver atlanticum]|uniref:Uncharacterized protein n=1 Tax=Papaver atlanticum TaxID=357466 RepID=A0AAD4S1U7_9MAGN|nr:hypothetical protein MKW98_028621 [Papaver atlanticum]
MFSEVQNKSPKHFISLADFRSSYFSDDFIRGCIGPAKADFFLPFFRCWHYFSVVDRTGSGGNPYCFEKTTVQLPWLKLNNDMDLCLSRETLNFKRELNDRKSVETCFFLAAVGTDPSTLNSIHLIAVRCSKA